MRNRCSALSPAAGLPVMLAFCLVLGLVWRLAPGWGAPAADLSWTTYRHDAHRTGRSLGTGNIRTPAIAWRHPVGGRRALVEVSRESGRRRLSVPFAKDLDPDTFGALVQAWDASYRTLDLAGDGKPVRVREATNVRYARFLPGAAGFQKFVMEDGMAVKNRPDGPRRPVSRGSLYRYDRGREELVWQTEPEEQCEIPLCAVADMDGDGAPDIAVSTWYRVMVFDAATGRKKMECRWHKGRNYGFFEVADLDGSGRPRCVVLADFMIHLNVLDNDGKALSLRWRKEVDFALFQKRKAIRVGPRPLVNLRGDAGRQIALNVYNDTGDERWHAVILDALTGEPLADLPDRFLHGAGDLDGDGRTELLLSEANGLSVPFVGRLFVARWRESLVEDALPHRGRWLSHKETVVRPEAASIAANGAETALVTDLDRDGAGEAWVVEPGAAGKGESLLALAARPGGGWSVAARCDLPPRVRASVAAVKPEEQGFPRAFLLSLESPSGTPASLAAAGLSAQVRAVGALALPPDVPVVGRMRPGEPPTAAVAAAGEVVAVRPPSRRGGSPRELWRAPGRAQTTDMSRFHGLEMADLAGDGTLSVLAADRVDAGQAALAAYGPEGRERWRHVFARFPGSDPHWNTGGLLLWTSGFFLQPGKGDVYVCLRRSAMHTDESCVFDGRTGREAWWQGNLDQRGCGGAPVALRKGPDGRQAILGQYPDILFSLSGATGKPLSLRTFPHAELGGWSAYAMPVLADFEGRGELRTLMGRCTYSLALWAGDEAMLWHTPYLDGTSTAPALADLNGDGRLSIGATGYRGGFRCYDPGTGAVRWTYPAGATGDPAAADIDGDGKEEFLFASGKSLLALGESQGQARLVWKLDLPAAAHPPVLADADGDGKLEILLTAADGRLYCIAGDPR